MSSRPPSQAALNKAINGSTDQTSTQVRARPIREARPTQKAQYITDERREREHQRQKGKGKTTRRNVETRAPHEARDAVSSVRLTLAAIPH
ncbi:hypothetical protein L210DRAFT_3659280 [Boletus edulis BED1]|uniref:Uncharacterized protein n=1 Tax=Boletus edulis BED1 TaxID=1328754 RepID=A0AAD4B8I2_BOLED|nr:hypothetical protein L210DRAFT_3659280 [Boletus edulis BED1]